MEPAVQLCRCVGHSTDTRPPRVTFHAERQDTGSPVWHRLLALIDEAAADGRQEFTPLRDMDADEVRQVVTLPPTIAKLTNVRRLSLYGTNLVRLPPEIGAMTSLEDFDPYCSHRLHWYPYELTRCTNLKTSRVSTRVLYGNFKFRPPFPSLHSTTGADLTTLDPAVWGADGARTCSVCTTALTGELHQAWISLRVATDVLPFLVNACSQRCIAALPAPEPGYVPTPHTGGPSVEQPPPRR
ncbi:leucine-rich repeat domain-containing protein [Dactylosporangium vinaceum]|uniref:Leucine-rich repeat domain-containing protein n=1 Tax=Dactylosporangium vinaceum TaxID=53362 RepID=A0ABV5MBI0_9ACTN|nr:leucine-rich repeat domain-containing protein [Dactylosporangium vinaceum]UAB98456.1 leucine-rich repeat domain-containing protein [Dactylosporangium vinaceum]